MIARLIDHLKHKSIHTPWLGVARFLLALGMLLTIVFNDMGLVANHTYNRLPDYSARHTTTASVPLKQVDIFMIMPPAAAKGIAIVVLLLVMTGLVPQVTAVLHFIVCFGYYNYYVILNGGDQITYVLSLLLLPICLTDPRLNQWKKKTTAPSARNITANIALLVIQLQVAYVYLSAGYEKIFVKVWQQGTAVYYYTSHYRWGATGWLKQMNEWVTLTPAVRLLSWGAVLFELLLAASLFFSARMRKKLFIPALVFHFLILVNFGLVSFFFAMAGMLVLYMQAGDQPMAAGTRVEAAEIPTV